MMPHDADKSRQVLQLARQLAGNLSLPKETKTAQDLLEALPSRVWLPGKPSRRLQAPAIGPFRTRAALRAANPQAAAPPRPPSLHSRLMWRLLFPRSTNWTWFAGASRRSPPKHRPPPMRSSSWTTARRWHRTVPERGRTSRAIARNSEPENAGFARACNQGLRPPGRLLLFLNNDTQVTTAGWTRSPGRCAAADGIAGAKLLYANGSIQHAGIAFIGICRTTPIVMRRRCRGSKSVPRTGHGHRRLPDDPARTVFAIGRF